MKALFIDSNEERWIAFSKKMLEINWVPEWASKVDDALRKLKHNKYNLIFIDDYIPNCDINIVANFVFLNKKSAIVVIHSTNNHAAHEISTKIIDSYIINYFTLLDDMEELIKVLI